MSPSQSQELKQKALDLEAAAEDSTKGEAEIGRLAFEAAKLHFQLAKGLNEPPDPTRGNLPDPNSHINRAFLLIKRAKAASAEGQFKWGPREQRFQDEIDELYYKNRTSQPMIGSQIGLTEDYERIQRIKDRGLPESLGGKKMNKSTSKWSISKKYSIPWGITKVAAPAPGPLPAAPSTPPATAGEPVMGDPMVGKPIGGWSLMTKDGKPMGQTGTTEEARQLAQKVLQGHPEILDLNLMGPDGTFVKSISRIK